MTFYYLQEIVMVYLATYSGVLLSFAQTTDQYNLNTLSNNEGIDNVTSTESLEPMSGVKSFSIESSTSTSVASVNTALPADCSQREKNRGQPIAKSSSRLRKCCPLGENLNIYRENQSDSMCDNGILKFEPDVISAVLFDNCIEDLEIETILPYDIGNPCNSSFQYDDEEDVFFVLQDGSLLIIDHDNESYTVEKNYCLDIDKTGHLFAFTCITQVEEQIAFAKVVMVAVLMLISMPCLLLVSYLHLTLRLLRNLHGLSLSLMSLCLASGYFVHSVVHIYEIPNTGFIGYVVQFFILSYFCWYFCICFNVLFNVWYKLPCCIQLTKTWATINFVCYCLIAFTGPATLVALTVQKGLPGMPSYFLQGLTESIRESQRYFIPPVSTILICSFLVNIISFFGFQRINGYAQAEKNDTAGPSDAIFDQQKYEDVKKDAKCVSLLGIIMIISWLFEIVTFYSGSNSNYLLLCDMVNGLQGVWVLLIFLVVRRRRTIILRWWYDRGSHKIEGTELQELDKNVNQI
ncbi:probable G-protein coupled receptor Mth-like 14 isoform X1 [Drosophila guanche]|uniref:Blast:Probable G-protein coupled receptor Mth-like 14 n=1 Tax=Drosophila guanche TaxID=7266 RepID=A0A3B0KF21_DROGU|nr:probable G-protein coupled receptor Mth-like 14 isoform X1 [Drosophila guanche]SPP86930.1 blast:Probable G-protein coupled receptor Mth-like 14 [Drosophila guanche]